MPFAQPSRRPPGWAERAAIREQRVALTALGDRVCVALAPGTSLPRRVAVLALPANGQNSNLTEAMPGTEATSSALHSYSRGVRTTSTNEHPTLVGPTLPTRARNSTLSPFSSR
jgi:hypothetical protein